MTETVMAHPFVKWAGGKTQLLPELLKRVPKHFNTYHEPFVGGGAMYFAMVHLTTYPCFLSDLNSYLITAYKAIRDDVDGLIEILSGYAEVHSPVFYASIRQALPLETRPAHIAAAILYLNRTCFNGLFRMNRKGEFNVPQGKFVKPPKICDAENLRACSNLLASTTVLKCQSFEDACANVHPGDFVYFDPPYTPPDNQKAFTSYTSTPFGQPEQFRLLFLAKELKSKGAHVLLSSAGTDEMAFAYRTHGFRVDVVKARRAISCKGDNRAEVKELLVY
jgi:DNA adenine methylase